MAQRIKIGPSDVLLAVDLQYDFMPGGALGVADGDAVLPLINRLAGGFANVALTQDWHAPSHVSFASSHFGAKPFETIRLRYGEQTLWPDHCVEGSAGAALHADLTIPHAFLILRKGVHGDVDSYSAFAEADGSSTGLAAMLRARGLGRVFLSGVATDFCVAFSALDAASAGFETFIVEDACRAIDVNGSLGAARARMAESGVRRIVATDIVA
jgi:nicotinamidase/pyrazinamidase